MMFQRFQIKKLKKIRIIRAKMSIKKIKLMEEKVYLFLRQNLLSINGTSTANGEEIVDDNNRKMLHRV